ncbi:DUF2218 domain-containing protein [Litoribrevibacter albus]|uniref:DUF2218 domain-containing protein n=1 Tax=Litoribrevibacter albus TaxID=1473156 RepID=A0AA37W8S2_9GAMM|nr:DUF2218 domain-containing protein [Litoribrevibacter albus]GLQ32848.1 hypothetical protein GCM10007876_33270 [Litoribrevibacter albus]
MHKKGVVNTQAGERYIHRLCKHFTHRVPATWSANEGLVEFDMGTCRMTSNGQALSFVCMAENDHDLNEILDTVKGHFDRFAVKDQLVLNWL